MLALSRSVPHPVIVAVNNERKRTYELHVGHRESADPGNRSTDRRRFQCSDVYVRFFRTGGRVCPCLTLTSVPGVRARFLGDNRAPCTSHSQFSTTRVAGFVVSNFDVCAPGSPRFWAITRAPCPSHSQVSITRSCDRGHRRDLPFAVTSILNLCVYRQPAAIARAVAFSASAEFRSFLTRARIGLHLHPFAGRLTVAVVSLMTEN